ncbi:hypothetical protein SAMN05216548_12915 [Faunimonas pinastri]|uniref:Uncharacterized protein n=1 Tax=Faunimonas pinastri TaxID=1855383 RepID=A0A1H9QIN1_9HYPH|nr:hypothetical protein [Faunimonas pinastri]SER60277.1 hypothetical protein SAMN05216548_12915 [Faunimonas pinastri]
MVLSPNAVGALIDDWEAQRNVSVVEANHALTLARLDVTRARQATEALRGLGWPVGIVDAAQQPTDLEQLDPDLEPFIVTAEKPDPAAGLRFLTQSGFVKALVEREDGGVWQVAASELAFSTGFASIHPWGGGDVFAAASETKSPLDLVREAAESRVVPGDIRRWLLRSPVNDQLWNDKAFASFAAQAVPALLRSIAAEVVGRRTAVFIGPPNLSIDLPDQDLSRDLGSSGFGELQAMVGWVYEEKAAAEQRHALIGAELARSFPRGVPIGKALPIIGRDVLNGARLAYQLSQSDLGRQALSAQGDLRKMIAEDASKAADSTRALVTAISVSLATGIGLVAARSTSTTAPWILSSVALVVAAYLLSVTVSGWLYLKLQRSLREQWRHKIYRFISDVDYREMVLTPAKQAEFPYYVVASVGILVAIVLILVAVSNYDEPLSKVLHQLELWPRLIRTAGAWVTC